MNEQLFLKIKKLLALGITYEAIATEFGVGYSTVSKVKKTPAFSFWQPEIKRTKDVEMTTWAPRRAEPSCVSPPIPDLVELSTDKKPIVDLGKYHDAAVLVSALIERVSRLKMNGKAGIVADLTSIWIKLTT